MKERLIPFLVLNYVVKKKFHRAKKNIMMLLRSNGGSSAVHNLSPVSHAFVFLLFYHQTIITETSRKDSTWILDGEVTDRSALGEEAESFCAKYKMYKVKEMQESMKVTEMRTKGKKIVVWGRLITKQNNETESEDAPTF